MLLNPTRKQRLRAIKILSFFSVIRFYNIALIVIAQYLTVLFILAPRQSWRAVFKDLNLLALVVSTSFVIASGYIINNFYDKEKDSINRPTRSIFDRLVSQEMQLRVYFLCNLISVTLAFFVSFWAAVFFSCYIFLVWFYSHKVKRITFLGNVFASILSLLPFFVVFIYVRNFNKIIFIHAIFLFLLLLVRELLKDMENIKGDLILNYKTVPVRYGNTFTKACITFYTILIFVVMYFLISFTEIKEMIYYFYFTFISLIVFLVILWRSNNVLIYKYLHYFLRLLILIGVISITLIDVPFLMSKINNI